MVSKSLRELIGRTREQFKALGGNANIFLSDRYLASELISSSQTKIKGETDKRKLWNSSNIFTPFCVELEPVSLSQCGSFMVDKQISKSKIRLPRIAEGTNFGLLIQGLWSIDIVSSRFYESDPNRFANSLSLGNTTRQVHYWIKDQYLYLSEPLIQTITGMAYFEEDLPDEMIYYPDYCNNPVSSSCCPIPGGKQVSTGGNDMSLCCPPNPLNLPSRVPGYLEDIVINMVSEKLMKTFEKIPSESTSGIPQSKK